MYKIILFSLFLIACSTRKQTKEVHVICGILNGDFREYLHIDTHEGLDTIRLYVPDSTFIEEVVDCDLGVNIAVISDKKNPGGKKPLHIVFTKVIEKNDS